MATIAPVALKQNIFPKNDVIKALLDELLEVASAEAQVRTGGYASVQAAMDHLVPRIQVAWDRKKAKKT